MSQIISTYPIFEGSQVLTSTQLNQLSAYLDQQGRLTRSKLIGIGIVCGMQVQPFPQGLQITKGLGVTSEGFLIQSGTFNATHYRQYTLPEGVEYKPFKDVGDEVSLFELLTEIPTDSTGVKKLNNPANFLNNKYVLIFLEIFDKDLKSCLGNACDDRGQDRLLTIRRLVVNEADLDKILTKSSNVRNPFPNALDLPEFHTKKPLFYPNNPESNDYESFVKHYQKTVAEILNDEFFKILEISYGIFEPILSKSYGFSNPLANASLSSKISEIKSILEADPSEIQGVQYLWDFTKELVKAYMEFRDSALELWYTCPADSSLFPLHLMLGRAKTDSETQAQFLKYRHGFIQPPIFNQQKLLAETCIQRHRRIILLIEKLETGILTQSESGKFPIKITPSVEKQGLLGSRALPYYYDIKSKSLVSSWYSLENSWIDPGNLQLGSTERSGVQAYDNQPDDEATEAKSILETPLFYDVEEYPFFRIEGHLGKPLNASLSHLKKLILQFNLPIHLDVLHLGDSDEPNSTHCGWNDLQEEYAFQRHFMSGMIMELKQLFDYVTEYAKENGEEDFTSDKFYIKASEVLELLLALAKALPECLKDLDWGTFQNTYKKLLQLLIDFVLLDLELLGEIKTSPEKENELGFYNGILTRLSPIVYRILDLFFFTKLQRIYTSYENRIHVLSQSNQFANYLKRHNGLTHEAGVLRAGTFFILHDPKQERIIGDFSLPYYCCDCTPCVDACGERLFSLPPFARPDYAIAYSEKTIKLEITVNDFLVSGRSYEVLSVGTSSTHNGKVEKDPESNTFRYTSAPGFTGVDSFQYVLRDTESKLSDQGKVSILVRGAQGCYSNEVLVCWGIDRVRETLRIRGIEVANEPDQRAVELLSESLSKSKGFSIEEIRFNVLESQEARVRLLTCLGYTVANMSYEQLEQAILDHQGKNCGAIVTPECMAMGIKGNVKSPDGKNMPRVSVSLKGFDDNTSTDGNGNYNIQFPSPRQTVVFEFDGFKDQEVEICSQEEVNVTMVPSAKSAKECYNAEIISKWPENLIRTIAKSRQLTNPSGNLPEVISALLASLRETFGFTSTELREITLKELSDQKAVLESIERPFSDKSASKNAETIEAYQNENCGSNLRNGKSISLEVLDEKDLKLILDTREVKYLPNADIELLRETLKSTEPAVKLKEKELNLLKKDTLVAILEGSSTTFNRADTKKVLIDKILGK